MDGLDLSVDLERLIAADPRKFLVDMDRELVAQHGLRMFYKLAWHTIEGSDASFKSNWHIDAIAEHLEAVSDGQLRRLMIAMPPRHMKSIGVAVMWPAWDWLKNPWRRFLFSSYAQGLSIRDNNKTRRVIMSPWFQERWGDKFQLTNDQNTKIRFENDQGGYRMATSVGGMNTGWGGDIIGIDDPHNVKDGESELVREGTLTWFHETMTSRLNDPNTGAFVIVHQRVNERDLIGDLIKRGGYTYLCLPAEYDPKHKYIWVRDPRKQPGELLWPEHFGRVALDALKNSLGPYAAAGQLQQLPAPREGGLFKRHYFKIVEVIPEDCIWARGWDWAATEKSLLKPDPDWTATVKIGWSESAQRWFIDDVQRWREEPHEIERIAVHVAEQDDISTIIGLPQDPAAAGKSHAQRMISLLAKFNVSADPVQGDKVLRSMSWAGKAGAGMICMRKADWNDDFLTEVTSFPTGAHDDMVDAASTAFDRLTSNTFGIMDYYRKMLDQQGKDEAEAKRLKEEAVAAGPLVFKGASQLVREATVDEYAAALAGKKGGEG
jgi:predicted phage terminase large subunit-like protein